MPWTAVSPMEELIRFVALAQTDRFTVTDLCEGRIIESGFVY